MSIPQVVLQCDAAPLEAAIASLTSFADISQSSAEVVRTFLDGLGDAPDLVRVESKNFLTGGASECGVVFHPSDCLADFLVAMGAGN